ncbi:MAG: L-serine ammonia-lyase, iron-sulfur-dependent, subunit alpha [Atopobiaceae bacterium]|nr:L-serine ammonia-lyase, iron-sulfur-dependent, subunit alpha [Atopobiaceae bacterium]MBR3385449.1 L-serine ammonia-lyase, iron-sulfur-dependent, subunit alpha [Atopobiaceae bacterium]
MASPPSRLPGPSPLVCSCLAAQLALSGVTCPVPFDEAVDAMAKVGRALPENLRETAQGGLAACPSVCGGCGGCA